MELNGKVAIVTGGAGGIGAALARHLVEAGASVAITDLDQDRVDRVAADINSAHPDRAFGFAADASSTGELTALIKATTERFGPIDLYCANAGIIGEPGLGDTAPGWDRAIEVNLLAHVRAAQLLIPQWLERGSGYFVTTASAAGLLTQIAAAQYSVTKHAAVGFAEWLSVTYGNRGIKVSCLCPMGVNTAMHSEGLVSTDPLEMQGARVVAKAGAVVEPDDVAAKVIEAIGTEQFLILPHPEVLDMYRRKGADYDRWLRGMRRLQADTE